MKRLIALIALCLLPTLAEAQSITQIAKNVTGKYCGSIYDSSTAKRLTAAVTGIDCEYAQVLPGSADESAFADLSTAERVVGTVGQFCYTITNTEDNIDGEIRVSCKATNTNAADYERLFTTMPVPLVTLVTTTTTATTASTCTNLTNLPSIPNNWLTAAGINADAFTAAKFASDVGDEFATAVWAAATRTLTGTQTFNNTGTWTGNVVGTLSTVTTLTNLPAITANWITAAGTANDFIAEVKAQVVAGLSTDTYAELAACPAATASITDILQFLFMDSRNKITATATSQKLKKDDATTDLCTFTTSDDGTTFSRGEGS